VIISLEGVDTSNKEKFTEHLVANKPKHISRVICCPYVSPIINPDAFKSWMYTVTRASELWREACITEDTSIKVFENSPFSIPSYVKALTEPFGIIGKQEYELINEIIVGLSELMPTPDIIVLFEPDDLNQEMSRSTTINNMVTNIHTCLNNWVKKQEAKVIFVPHKNPDQPWDYWFKEQTNSILAAIESLE
jgi:hypothetical protein